MRQRPFRSVLDVPPKKEELEVALSALKNGRSSGKNGLTLEVVKHVGTVFDEYLLELFQAVWEAGKVPRANTVLVPILKKEDLSICDIGGASVS